MKQTDRVFEDEGYWLVPDPSQPGDGWVTKMLLIPKWGGWTFNGDYERPTFSPSVRETGGANWDYINHVFVRDGQIQYLSDCTHEYAGKTIDIPMPSDEDYAAMVLYLESKADTKDKPCE